MMKVLVPVGSQRDTHNRTSLIMAPATVPEAVLLSGRVRNGTFPDGLLSATTSFLFGDITFHLLKVWSIRGSLGSFLQIQYPSSLVKTR